jgi:PTH1 family peptidyl-tRNA hydrolase
MKFHKNRGHGGQNGVKNISELLGTQDYSRLKLGVGRPEHPGFDIADYVLSAFTKDEDQILRQVIGKAIDGIECFIFKGLNQASTDFNGPLKGVL